MVYSNSSSSGEATAVHCMMRYLGQEDVRALDDGPDKWIAANGNEGERAFAGEPCCLPSIRGPVR